MNDAKNIKDCCFRVYQECAEDALESLRLSSPDLVDFLDQATVIEIVLDADRLENACCTDEERESIKSFRSLSYEDQQKLLRRHVFPGKRF